MTKGKNCQAQKNCQITARIRQTKVNVPKQVRIVEHNVYVFKFSKFVWSTWANNKYPLLHCSDLIQFKKDRSDRNEICTIMPRVFVSYIRFYKEKLPNF